MNDKKEKKMASSLTRLQTSVYKTNQLTKPFLSLFFIHPLTQFSYFCLATHLFFKPFSSFIPPNFILSPNSNPQKKTNFFWWKKFQRQEKIVAKLVIHSPTPSARCPACPCTTNRSEHREFHSLLCRSVSLMLWNLELCKSVALWFVNLRLCEVLVLRLRDRV